MLLLIVTNNGRILRKFDAKSVYATKQEWSRKKIYVDLR